MTNFTASYGTVECCMSVCWDGSIWYSWLQSPKGGLLAVGMFLDGIQPRRTSSGTRPFER